MNVVLLEDDGKDIRRLQVIAELGNRGIREAVLIFLLFQIIELLRDIVFQTRILYFGTLAALGKWFGQAKDSLSVSGLALLLEFSLARFGVKGLPRTSESQK